MNICSRCNSYVPDGANVCPNCGNVINGANQQFRQVPQQYPQPQAQPQPNYQYQQPQQFEQPQAQPAKQSDAGALTKKAHSLGIVAIITGFLFPLVAWICGGIGIAKAGGAFTYANSIGDMMLAESARHAKKLNVIGIVVSIALRVVAVILYIILFAVIGVSSGAFDSLT